MHIATEVDMKNMWNLLRHYQKAMKSLYICNFETSASDAMHFEHTYDDMVGRFHPTCHNQLWDIPSPLRCKCAADVPSCVCLQLYK